jgi:hypothetical protein
LCPPETAEHRIARHRRPRQDEPLLVKLHTPAQPLGVRIGPDEEEQRRRVDPRLNAGIVADADRSAPIWVGLSLGKAISCSDGMSYS